jgi:DNA polymerase-3 subunit delta'
MFFSEIIGQPKAVRLLSRAIGGNRLAHGYLFTGPEGVGKTTTARALAAILLCEADGETRPCGHCPGCVKFASGNHPDFLTIRPDGAVIKIEQIRRLKKDLSFAPFEAGTRVVILEDAQTMQGPAGNSLLKILEEPPPDNLLLLVASDAEPMLATIVSRCQVIPFMPLNPEETCTILRKRHPERDEEEIRTLAQLCGGCPGQVREIDSDELLLLRGRCIDGLLHAPADPARSVEQALALAADMGALKDRLEPLLDMLAVFFKETMVSALCEPEPDAAGETARARERWNLQQLSDMVDAVDHARRALARNCNRALVCEVLMLELFSC